MLEFFGSEKKFSCFLRLATTFVQSSAYLFTTPRYPRLSGVVYWVFFIYLVGVYYSSK